MKLRRLLGASIAKRSRRRLWPTFLAAAAAIAMIVIGAIRADGWGGDQGDRFSAELQQCINSERSLSVLILLDESGSLRTTDPSGQRVVAAKTVLGILGGLGAESVHTDPITVEVAIAAFGEDYVENPGGFRRLSEASEASLKAELDAFASRNRGRETDYVRGLLGAIDTLERQDGCRLIVWFTDGQYDIDLSGERSDYDDRIGATPPLAGRVVAYEDAGREWLCAEGGVADAVRSGGIFLLTGTLSFEPPEEMEFTRRITEGVDSFGRPCGELTAEAARLGRFVTADRAEDLLWVLTPGSADPDERGSRSFALTYGMTRVFVVMTTDSVGVTTTLVSPTGAPMELVDGISRSVDGADIEYEALSPTAGLIRMQLDPQLPMWVGEWDLNFDPPELGRSRVYFYGELRAIPTAERTTTTAGALTRVAFRVVDWTGTPPSEEEQRILRVSGTFMDGGSGRTIPGTWGEDGTFVVEFAAPEATGVYRLDPTVAILVPDSGVVLPFAGESAQIVVDPVPTTTIPPEPLAPSVLSGAVSLPALTGPGSSVRPRGVRVEGGSDSACMTVISVSVTALPDATSSPSIALVGPDGSSVPTAPECDPSGPAGSIHRGQTIEFDFQAEFSEVGRGVAEGTVLLGFVTADGARASELVRFSVRVSPERSWSAFATWFAVLAGAGAGGGLLAGGALAARRGRRPFIPSPNNLSIASLPATVTVEGGFGRVSWTKRSPMDPAVQFAVLGGDEVSGRIVIPGDLIGTVDEIVLVAPPNGIYGQRGAVQGPEPPVVTSVGERDIDLDLRGAWVFVARSVKPSGAPAGDGEVDDVRFESAGIGLGDGEEVDGVCEGVVVLFRDDADYGESVAVDETLLGEGASVLIAASAKELRESDSKPPVSPDPKPPVSPNPEPPVLPDRGPDEPRDDRMF